MFMLWTIYRYERVGTHQRFGMTDSLRKCDFCLSNDRPISNNVALGRLSPFCRLWRMLTAY